MNISYNWLKDYLRVDLTPERVAEILTAIGLEVESVDPVEPVPGGLKGVVVGEVLTCSKHPDADRLSITTVNLGQGDPVQIVCGAPNVAAGQKVLVATVGTTLHPRSGEPFTIKKSKIRGAESIGMICAEDELGIGESHAGILVLDATAVPGTPAADQLQLSTDFVLSIGLTPNRTDAFSHVGVARDLAAALGHMEGIERMACELTLPSLPALQESAFRITGVQVHHTEACGRYSGITLTNVRVEPSPQWLQDRLTAIGLRPINNIVDITNYVQHEIGQPLHAFDADQIAGGQVHVRLASEGEKFTTLDGVERTLSASDLMICDAEKPMCIAGVFGGLNSGVTENTTSVFLESAWFNPVFVRKTARRHGLNTDASFRFERGCDPSVTTWALLRATALICEIAGAEVASPVTDTYPVPAEPCRIHFRQSFADRLIGKSIPAGRMEGILAALDIRIIERTNEGWMIEIPLYRVDVRREADVVEEVLRIYGFDAVDSPALMRLSLSSAPKPDPEEVQYRTGDLLAAQGFHEIMGMSLTRTKYLQLDAQPEERERTAVHLLNPLSSDLGMMRQTLLFTGLEAIALNQNHRNADLRLFEFGKVYNKYESGYHEEKHLAVYLTGRNRPESWNNADQPVGIAELKGVTERILHHLRVPVTAVVEQASAGTTQGLVMKSGKHEIVRMGAVDAALLKSFDIRQPVWYADLAWEKILSLIPSQPVKYQEPEKFPYVRRDLSLLIDQGVSFDAIRATAFESERKLLREVNLFDVYEGKNLDAGKKSYAVSFILQDATKTMTDDQVEKAMGRIFRNLEEKLGARLRS